MNDLAELVRERLDYSPETGVSRWKVSFSNGINAGDIAGCSNKINQYITIRIDGKNYLAHRLAWLSVYGELPSRPLDHINGIRTDNRIANLRLASPIINNQNRKRGKNNSSGILGVSFSTRYNKWQAKIGIKGRHKILAWTDDFFEACCARKAAEIEHGFHPNHGKIL